MMRFIFLLLLCFSSVHARDELPKRHRSLLITGTPFSGLEYTSRLLFKAGLHITHERSLGQDGIASWFFAVPAKKSMRGPIPSTVTFDHIFHQVRNPLKVIAAMNYNPSADGQKLDEFLYEYIPEISRDDPPFLKRVKIWYYWNLLAEERAEWTYRIEDIELAFFEMEERLRLLFDNNVIEKNPFIGTPRTYTWRQLEERLRLCGDRKFINKVKELAAHYGYDTED